MLKRKALNGPRSITSFFAPKTKTVTRIAPEETMTKPEEIQRPPVNIELVN